MCVLWGLLMHGSTAAAQEPPSREVEALAARAQRAFKSGKFGDAIALYLKAYRSEQVGILLYNIAYVYDQKLSESELAVEYYRRYIKAVDAEPELVQKATQRLKQLRTVAPAAVPAPSVAKKPKGAVEPTTVMRRENTAGPASHVQRNAGWSLVGIGGATLVTGIVFGVLGQQQHSTYTSSRVLAERLDAQSSGKTYALVADVMMAVGATATITGLVLALTAPTAPTVGVGAMSIPGGGALVFSGQL